MEEFTQLKDVAKRVLNLKEVGPFPKEKDGKKKIQEMHVLFLGEAHPKNSNCADSPPLMNCIRLGH